MKVNDIIKTKSGKIFTVQRAEILGPDNREYLLLYEVNSGDLAIGYNNNGTLMFVNDTKQVLALAKEFDKKQSKK